MKDANSPQKTKRYIKKNVSTIHINARLTLTQRKLVNALLYNAYDALLSEDTHSIPVSILSEMISFDSRNQAHLRKAIRGLTETSVEWDIMEDDGTNVWEVSSLLSSARIRAGICTYRYDRGLAEKLKHPDIYSKINLSVIRELRSSHALVLYENCHRYVNVGNTAWWDLDVFRKLMSVDEMASYQEYKILKRDLITPAVNEVNKLSNIQIELETRRKGRSVTGLRFLVRPNKQLSLVGMEDEDEITQSAAYTALVQQGIAKTLARSWVVEHDEKYIFEKIELANERAANGKIRSSKAGFLKSAIEDDYHNEAAAKKEQEKAAELAKQSKQQLEAQRDRLRRKLRDTENAYRKSCLENIQSAYEALPEAEKKAMDEDFQRSLSSLIFVNAFKDGGWFDRRIYPQAKAFWENQGISFPAAKEWAEKNGSQEPQDIKAEMNRIEELLTV